MIQQGYCYTKDLQCFEAMKPKVPPQLPVLGQTITSPLIVHNWKSALKDHPDQLFVSYLLEGRTNGFHIGFSRELKCISAMKNMWSALQKPDPVDKQIVGPFNPEQAKGAHISHFGVIPKSGQPDKWRLILDLSSPRDHSINDGIEKQLCSFKYVCISGRHGTISAEVGPERVTGKSRHWACLQEYFGA